MHVAIVLLLLSLSYGFCAILDDEGGHIFTSTHKLTLLMDEERNSLKVMKDYIARQREAITKLKHAQLRIQEGHGVSQPAYYTGIDHPLNAYRLVHRFVAHWKNVYALIFNATSDQLYHDKVFANLVALIPHPTDYYGAYKSLLRLQMTYEMSAKSLADGLIRGRMSDPLDEMDCYNMALTAIQRELCQEALDWTRIAGEKTTDPDTDKEEILTDVLDFEQRLKAHGAEKMKDVILEYLMDAVGMEVDNEKDEDEEQQKRYEEFQKRYENIDIKPDEDLPGNDETTHGEDQSHEDESDEDDEEVGDDNFVEGELNIAEYTSEMEQQLEEMDQFEYKKQLLEEQQKQQADPALNEQTDDTAGEGLDLDKAIERAQEDLQNLANENPSQSKCGGDQDSSTPLMVEEREIEFDSVGFGAGLGKTLKIRYQGKEIPEEELDEIENMVEEIMDDRRYGDKTIDEMFNFFALCRGEEIKKREALTCRYRYADRHYNVWKEEVLNKDPYIAIMYDFISDPEMKEMRQLSMASLMRARAGDKFIEERVQSSSWHDDTNSSTVLRLSKRAAAVTGLDCLDWAEEWQVGQYGIGGHYSAHYDYDINGYKDSMIRGKVMGDRLATFMLYLNHVEEGGYTVFPRLGLHVRPVKGAAVFWYNYMRTGEAQSDTLHAACPVLLGHKWVANKWVREFGHEFIKPCGRTKAVTSFYKDY